MPIKNYTSKMPVSQSLAIIQQSLVDHGATGFMFEYDKQGRISVVRFRMDVGGRGVPFSLPVEWRKFQEVLKRDGAKRWEEEDYCYRVAWANLRDLVVAQMAFIETDMVEIPQMFLGYAVDRSGKMIYDKMKSSNFLLGEGK